MNLAIVMPTIPQRRESRQVTIDQIEGLGLGIPPIIVEQDPDLPLGSASCLATTKLAIEAGLDSGADSILLLEDDVDIDPWLGADIYYYSEVGRVISFWHRPRFVPSRYREIEGRLMVEAIGLKDWFSTLGIMFPLDIAYAFVDTPPSLPDIGSDIHLREILMRLDVPLWLTLPSLVEHRPGKRYATKAHFHIMSEDYTGPKSWDPRKETE